MMSIEEKTEGQESDPRRDEQSQDYWVELASEFDRLVGSLPGRINLDPDSVEKELAKLVLTLVEFIRRLLERQAVRRVEGGGLTPEQIENLGLALMRLEAKLQELKSHFGLEDEDLNLDLGPLGRLI